MSSFSTHPCLANLQLHPPSSQTAYPSPIASPLTPCPPPVARAGVPATRHPNDDIASMKGFVHEVLRRSRTSGSVLQTALCYLEAIRQKIPDLVRQEKQGPGTALEDRSAERSIQVEDSAITADDTVLDGPRSVSGDVTSSDGFLATVRIGHAVHSTSNVFLDPRPNRDFPPVQEPKASMRALPPLPPLPSPLLCPRRTFLASLILASKFMQDRCYSNRAWAKLSGLPPREIGRCERALGEALEWRLWVGKLPAAQSDHRRSLAKSRSETDILTASKSPEPFLPTYDRMELSTPQWDPTSLPVPRSNARLKRHATHPSISSCKEEPSLVTSIEAIASSPSTCTTTPSTPGLSFSPTPTESSLGDRTIQISSFMDVPTPPPGQFAAFASAQNDKVLLASNGPCIFSTSQDSSLLSRPFEGRVHIPTNVLGFPLPPYGAMYPHWSSEYA
ncbi:hypothetical protein ID866_768 [Astraeus odoratus]|nr:hypothetical protein ID866_768 [Astraeus odoratus]